MKEFSCKSIIFSIVFCTLCCFKLLSNNFIDNNNYEIYFSIIDPVTQSGQQCNLSRAQYLIIQIERRLTKHLCDTSCYKDKLLNILSDLKPCGELKYSSKMLAMEWKLENDTLLSLPYIGKPIVGMIWIAYPAETKRSYGVELIWISRETIAMGNNEYIISDELREFLNKYVQRVIIPEEYIDDCIVPIV